MPTTPHLQHKHCDPPPPPLHENACRGTYRNRGHFYAYLSGKSYGILHICRNMPCLRESHHHSFFPSIFLHRSCTATKSKSDFCELSMFEDHKKRSYKMQYLFERFAWLQLASRIVFCTEGLKTLILNTRTQNHDLSPHPRRRLRRPSSFSVPIHIWSLATEERALRC